MRVAGWGTLLLLVLVTPGALAQDPWVYQGGEPGVEILADGASIVTAASAGEALPVDTGVPLPLSVRLSPTVEPGWELRAISVGLLVNGPGSEPPELLARQLETQTSIPFGWSVVINRSIDLSALQRVGAGTYLMQAQVRAAGGAILYEREFYVHVPVTAATLLTAQGAAITVVSVATGYGFWQIAKDVKELRDAWDRHRRKKELAKLDVIGKAEHVLENVAEKGGKPLASAVGMHRAVQASEKQLGPVRWMATGLGLGGVAVAWLQFLGYLTFSGIGMLVAGLEGAAIFLTVALLTNYLLRRARASASASAGAEVEVSRSVPVEEGSVTEEAAHNRD